MIQSSEISTFYTEPLALSNTPLSCLPPNDTDHSSKSWPRFKMAAALTQRRCYSLIAILDFSLCGALGIPCIWQMLSYVHELTYRPMICSFPSSLLTFCTYKYQLIGRKSLPSLNIKKNVKFPKMINTYPNLKQNANRFHLKMIFSFQHRKYADTRLDPSSLLVYATALQR